MKVYEVSQTKVRLHSLMIDSDYPYADQIEEILEEYRGTASTDHKAIAMLQDGFYQEHPMEENVGDNLEFLIGSRFLSPKYHLGFADQLAKGQKPKASFYPIDGSQLRVTIWKGALLINSPLYTQLETEDDRIEQTLKKLFVEGILIVPACFGSTEEVDMNEVIAACLKTVRDKGI